MTWPLPIAAPCPKCSWPIRWVYTSKGGRMPIDAQPQPDGDRVLVLADHNGRQAWTSEHRRGYRALDLKAQGHELYRFHQCPRDRCPAATN